MDSRADGERIVGGVLKSNLSYCEYSQPAPASVRCRRSGKQKDTRVRAPVWFLTGIALALVSASQVHAIEREIPRLQIVMSTLPGNPDAGARSPGLLAIQINVQNAIPACEAANEKFPGDVRLEYQLARSYYASQTV